MFQKPVLPSEAENKYTTQTANSILKKSGFELGPISMAVLGQLAAHFDTFGPQPRRVTEYRTAIWVQHGSLANNSEHYMMDGRLIYRTYRTLV